MLAAFLWLGITVTLWGVVCMWENLPWMWQNDFLSPHRRISVANQDLAGWYLGHKELVLGEKYYLRVVTVTGLCWGYQSLLETNCLGHSFSDLNKCTRDSQADLKTRQLCHNGDTSGL